MVIERGQAPAPEPGIPPAVGEGVAGPGGGPTPLQVRLQILSTEHWSLLASRGLAWNESFARAGMFLSTLSGAIVALSLIGGVDGFGAAFFAVALIVLPVVLFVGIGTWLRMGATNYHDAITVAGMNRIRAAYLEIAPDLEPYFVMGTHDDAPGIGITMAVPPGTPSIVHLIAGTPTLVIVLNGILAGAIAALVAFRVGGADLAPSIVIAVVVAAIGVLIQIQVAARNIRRGQQALRPLFPTPGGAVDARHFLTSRIPYGGPADQERPGT
jgi:hypothetical protein